MLRTAIGLALLATAACVHAACREPQDTAIPDIALHEVARGLEQPTAVVDDGDGRLFVLEQRGVVRIVDHGRLRPEPFLDLRDRVASGGEKGLLGLAFDPGYRRNGYFYLDYTSDAGGLHTVIARYRRQVATHADAASERVLLQIAQPYSNHNGGQLAFGRDGDLYIGMGDGGSANDPHGNGQNKSVLLGKLLRIDVAHAAGNAAYAIPRDNPFVGERGARGEIFAYGLRNPWRFSFDSANGRLYLADVGQDAVEEIDVIDKGGNYGWNVMEGDICTPGVNARCDRMPYRAPIATYRHDVGKSITGGYVYRGRRIPGLCGVYLYADFVSGRIWGLRYDGRRVRAQRLLSDSGLSVSTFGQDRDGEIYVADYARGRLYRIGPR